MTIPGQATAAPTPYGPDSSSTGNLHPKIESEFRALQPILSEQGLLPSESRLQGYYDTFRRKFGPEALRALDGLALLEGMHWHGNHDSLVYWLEFKNDEEFPAIFGSILGGSALKFGVYRRNETGAWAIKGPGGAPRDITTEQAIEIAERHREQLIAAADLVAAIPRDADDVRYIKLQSDLAAAAPDVQDTAWGHKYLSLLFPKALAHFHVQDWQRYNLIRVLQLPPRAGEDFAAGRYACGGRFVGLSRELGLPMQSLCALLKRRHGDPRRYWRVGTTDDLHHRRKYWPMMRDGDLVAIGWPGLGDLSAFSDNRESREAVKELLEEHYPGKPTAIGRAASQLLKFVGGMQEGDRILAADGMTVLGVGEISGSYQFAPSEAFPHQRPVAWRSLVEWKAVDAEALQTTVAAIRDYRNQVEVERHILEDADSVLRAATTKGNLSDASETRLRVRESEWRKPSAHSALPRLTGVQGKVQAVLDRKGQAVLYGPPGTGKTYWAIRTARDLAALRAFGARYEQLDHSQRARVIDERQSDGPLVRKCTFHPEFGYEDFIEGYRPRVGQGGRLGFILTPGIFHRICDDADRSPGVDFYLVIDELNRGDVPRIFGELLTLLELDKRGEKAVLPVSGEEFRVPRNVFIVATMNTADRSIALLDAALRRRFGFVEVMPDYALLDGATVGPLPLDEWLKDLNARIRDVCGTDARNRQIGHSYLLDHGTPISNVDQLAAVLRYDIVPLLEEYCYDDFDQLAGILGASLVDVNLQEVRQDMFEVGRRAELLEALMPPEVRMSEAAVRAEADEDGANDIDQDGEEDRDEAEDDDSSASAALT
jgi:5-methylcytosine-specific restriction protein B